MLQPWLKSLLSGGRAGHRRSIWHSVANHPVLLMDSAEHGVCGVVKLGDFTDLNLDPSNVSKAMGTALPRLAKYSDWSV